jgi:2,3-bisphosphoglycerate-dependent phosphoglycerate mutase
MHRLVLLRHGQSRWNRDGRFTGWADVDLTPRGEAQARRAGRAIAATGLGVDVAFTSVLTRAVRTLWLALEAMGRCYVPIESSFRLNERSYGALEGLEKDRLRAEVGDAQVHAWRRGYHDCPPRLAPDDERSPAHDPRYRDLDPAFLPLGESLADCEARVLPFYCDRIAPALSAGHTPLVVAHGNSLRALIRFLERLSPEAIERVEIEVGVPRIYTLGDALDVIARDDLVTTEPGAEDTARA